MPMRMNTGDLGDKVSSRAHTTSNDVMDDIGTNGHQGGVTLKPFLQRVGGHTPMFSYSSDTVAKLLQVCEHEFYCTIPRSLRPFTPAYRGVLDVDVQDEGEGYVTLVGCSGRNGDTSGTSATPTADNQEIFRMKRSGSVEVSEIGEEGGHVSERTAQNSKDRMASFLENHQLQSAKFVLLENLLESYRRACVADLKMGTRQHGDHSSQEKARLFTLRCQESTSASLGFRLCGMKVFQPGEGEYQYQDKYTGRGLTAPGVTAGLKNFLSDGKTLRTSVVRSLLKRLRAMKEEVSRLDSFRFYSSSLLLIYEGAEVNPVPTSSHGNCPAHPADESCSEGCGGSEDCDDVRVDCRMIDFAHSTHSSMSSSVKVHDGPDTGYLKGLESLGRILEGILRDRKVLGGVGGEGMRKKETKV